MQRPRARLLIAFVPAILLLSACGAVGAASVNRSTSSPSISTAAASESPTAFAVVEPSPGATPVVATPVVAAPVQPADPYAAAKAAGAPSVQTGRGATARLAVERARTMVVCTGGLGTSAL